MCYSEVKIQNGHEKDVKKIAKEWLKDCKRTAKRLQKCGKKIAMVAAIICCCFLTHYSSSTHSYVEDI